MKNPTFEVNFIIATIDPYSDGQSSLATCSIPTRITETNNEPVNSTGGVLKISVNRQCNISDQESSKLVCQGNAKTKNKNDLLLNELCTINHIPDKNSSEFSSHNGLSEDCENFDLAPYSPESPKTKRAKLIFGRCFESTFSKNILGDVLAPNSDSE